MPKRRMTKQEQEAAEHATMAELREAALKALVSHDVGRHSMLTVKEKNMSKKAKAKTTAAEARREQILASINRDADGEVILPLSVPQAAALWGKSESRVKILVAQGRVKHMQSSQGGQRAYIFIEQRDPPPDMARGELTEEQRAVKKGKRSHG